MEKNHLQAWLSEFVGTTILLFVSVFVARWLVGPDSALASAVPGAAANRDANTKIVNNCFEIFRKLMFTSSCAM